MLLQLCRSALMPIPPFNELGYLPPGIYEVSWAEFMNRFATNQQRQRLATGIAAAIRKLAIAGCRRVLIGGSFVTSKEHPNDFDGWYESFGLDLDILDSLFLEDVESQMEVFGGTLFDPPSYEGFFQTDREGRPKGVIILDPQAIIIQPGERL